jgi:hypothetical protein
LDYYASGEGFFFGRSGWTQNDAQVMFQLKELNGVGHAHMDAATFQIWRRGYWVSKESTGYDDTFADTTSEDLKAHNGLLVGGLGYTDGDTNGIPRVTRLESNPNYLYVTVDLSQYYRNNLVPYSDVAEDNPYVGSAIREFLFIKPLQTLVILDRVKSIVDTTRGGTGRAHPHPLRADHFRQQRRGPERRPSAQSDLVIPIRRGS